MLQMRYSPLHDSLPLFSVYSTVAVGNYGLGCTKKLLIMKKLNNKPNLRDSSSWFTVIKRILSTVSVGSMYWILVVQRIFSYCK